MSSVTAYPTLYINNTGYSTDDINYIPFSYPLQINNNNVSSDNLAVLFKYGITLTTVNDYFICGSDNIIFDGQNNEITVSITDYPGLIKNGNSTESGKNNVTVQSIGINVTNGSTLAQDGGWLCQSYFSNISSYNLIQNCYSNGDIINDNAGGICGGFAGNGGSNLTISNCYSSGNISGLNSGGICGQYAANGTTESGIPSIITITNCYSTGNISGLNSGGIFGSRAASNVGSININNCYSIGNINGENSGGIFATYASANFGSIIIANCYSIGNINGENSGGIFGTNAATGNSRTYIYTNNCYSIGKINGANSGGIFGSTSNGQVTITNSYCLNGNLVAIVGGPLIITNCYTPQGNWDDSVANNNLTDTPTSVYTPGSIWTSISRKTPYLLSTFNDDTSGVKTYNPNNVEIEYTQGQTYDSPNGIFTNPYVYSLLNVNNVAPVNTTINSNTGVISFTNLNYTYAVDYSANIFTTQSSDGSYFGYNFSNFFLTILQSNSIAINAKSNVLINASNQYSVDGGIFTPLPFPCEIVNNNPTVGPVTVNFLQDISYASTNNYFICGSDNIIFDGQNNSINVSATNFNGLILNNSLRNNINIQNIGITTIDSGSLSTGAGWILGPYSNGNIINNCYSTGNMVNSSGGICGQNSTGTITNCYSTGNIGDYSGGITGPVFGGTIKNCYSTGTIGKGGGISGNSGQNSSSEIINCYSLGTANYINESFGIIQVSLGVVIIENCYCLNGPLTSGGLATNCYVANGSWSDLSANAALTGTPSTPFTIGSIWASVEANGPYLLSDFNTIQTYDPNTLSIPAEYGTTFTTQPGLSPYGYKYYLLNVNDESTTSTINQSTGAITFRVKLTGPQNKTFKATMFSSLVVGDPVYYGYNFSTYTITLLYIPPFISNICFPANTPVKTNRGLIPIQKIDPSKHTINFKKIVEITETVSKDDYLVCFKKHSLKYNIPSQDTLISKDHKILYENELISAENLLDRLKMNKRYSKDDSENEKIVKVPYNGEPLYNVLMEEYDTMSVNNMTCETLHPNNLVAKLYNSKLTPEFKQNMIIKMNKSIQDNDHDSYKEGVIKFNTVAFLKKHLN